MGVFGIDGVDVRVVVDMEVAMDRRRPEPPAFDESGAGRQPFQEQPVVRDEDHGEVEPGARKAKTTTAARLTRRRMQRPRLPRHGAVDRRREAGGVAEFARETVGQ